MDNNAPMVVKIHDVNIDKDYINWIGELKSRYRSAQIKAAVKVNAEKLRFNWELGRDLVIRKAEERWGSGVVEQVSLDLQAAFPESKGFSASNLWRMKQWYQFFCDDTEKLAQVARELQAPDYQNARKLAHAVRENLHTANNQNDVIDFPEILACIPWGHHIEIIAKCKAIDEAAFYINKTISENWSRAVLQRCLKADLYHNSGSAVTNFSQMLPSPQSDLAQAITKDNYDFGFVELPRNYIEEQLEDELEKHLTRFLLELGTGFAFVGRQKEIVIAGVSRRIDLLFFHIPLNCYIVVELKVVPFQPEFAGKLNFYVNAVDDLIKTPEQNPTIGLLICSDKNDTNVQYAFKGITTPIGVASYDNVRIREIQDQLPSVEELTRRIRLLEEQLSKKK